MFNIACGERISLLEILEIVYRLAGRRVASCFKASRPGDVCDSLADITLAHTLLGYEPKTGFQKGLAQTCEFFLCLAG